MYTPPWIPRADPKFRTFAQNFCTGVSAHPATYMMTPAEGAKVMQDFVRFNAAYMVAVNPITRTRGTIIAKDDARSILQNTIQSYASFIRANQGIPDGDKINIGVRPRNVAHHRRRCPSTPPLLNYIGSLPGMDQLVFHDSSTPTSKAKPRGAERLELWVAYLKAGEAGKSKPRPEAMGARPIGSFKKSKMLIPQDPQCDVRLGGGEGMPVYFGRWVGYDGKAGPWSLPLWTTRAAVPAKKEKDASEAQPQSSENDQAMKMAA